MHSIDSNRRNLHLMKTKDPSVDVVKPRANDSYTCRVGPDRRDLFVRRVTMGIPEHIGAFHFAELVATIPTSQP